MRFQSPYLAIVDTVEEALEAKRRRPASRFLGGGTELVADQNLGLLQPDGYVSLRRVQELNTIEASPEGLRIGAGVVIARLLDDPLAAAIPLLRKAARSFGTQQIRNRATVGGNVASGLPDRTLPPCLLALNATVQLVSAGGRRSIPLHGFLVGAGQTAIGADELLVAVTVPRVEGYQHYVMVGPRNAQYYATASVALVVDSANRDVRLGLGNAGPTAMRSNDAEEFAKAAIDWDGETVAPHIATEFAQRAAAACAPPSDVTASSEYRRHAIKVMARRTLEQALVELAK